MQSLLTYQNFYLVGIKGVAMTSLAQILADAGKTVAGSDLAEDFVTKVQIDKLTLKIDLGFEADLPEATDCVIYTAAHEGKFNPQVIAAQKAGLPTFSQAEALGSLFNQKQGIAVCGVGGKSTVSAMITWILDQAGKTPSYSVGVGNIPGLDQTGVWNDSPIFVAEADEYVTDPSAPERGEEITPRFSFMEPHVTICTNLKYDHPDVYRDLAHTKAVYKAFFENIKEGGSLIINLDSEGLFELAKEALATQPEKNRKIITFGEHEQADFRLISYTSTEGKTAGTFEYQGETYELSLAIPGKFNLLNALAATAAATQVEPKILDQNLLLSFRSTARRFEFIGEMKGVKYYDDYAHHPHEVAAAITALNEWFPNAKKLIAFQSHTYTRTKRLFSEFVEAFAEADEVVMIDIFSSAREKSDPTVTSTKLCEAIHSEYPHIRATNLENIQNLAQYFEEHLQPGDVCLTVGAGDIYEVYELLKK